MSSSSPIEPPSKRQKLEGSTTAQTATAAIASSASSTFPTSSALFNLDTCTPLVLPSTFRNAFSIMESAQRKLAEDEKKSKVAAATTTTTTTAPLTLSAAVALTMPTTRESNAFSVMKIAQQNIARAKQDVDREAKAKQQQLEREWEERMRKEEEEEKHEKKKRKRSAPELRKKNALIQSVYSDEMKSSIREHLITTNTSDDIGMPNVLANLILEYTHHPILQLWEAIEARCQFFDPARVKSGDMPFIEFYTRGANHNDADSFAVSPERINQLEVDLRVKLNDSSFSLPDDLKILWSIRDGFSEAEWSGWGDFESTDQFLFGSILFPTIDQVEYNVEAAISPLHASYCILDAHSDWYVSMHKYHLREGIITYFKLNNDFGELCNSTIMPSVVDREKAAREYLTTSPPQIVSYSLRHYLERLLAAFNRINDEMSGWDTPAFYPPVGLSDDNDDDDEKEEEDKEKKIDHDPASSESESSATTPSTCIITQSRGHLTSAELSSLRHSLTWQHELSIMCELIALPGDGDYDRSLVHTYYKQIVELHGCTLFRSA